MKSESILLQKQASEVRGRAGGLEQWLRGLPVAGASQVPVPKRLRPEVSHTENRSQAG